MLKFHNRKGEEITYEQVKELMYDLHYLQVGFSVVGDRYSVSTIWTPLRQAEEGRIPLFETVIFDNDEPLCCWASSTEEQAKEMHDLCVKAVEHFEPLDFGAGNDFGAHTKQLQERVAIRYDELSKRT